MDDQHQVVLMIVSRLDGGSCYHGIRPGRVLMTVVIFMFVEEWELVFFSSSLCLFFFSVVKVDESVDD